MATSKQAKVTGEGIQMRVTSIGGGMIMPGTQVGYVTIGLVEIVEPADSDGVNPPVPGRAGSSMNLIVDEDTAGRFRYGGTVNVSVTP